jgi:hypothetical protein
MGVGVNRITEHASERCYRRAVATSVTRREGTMAIQFEAAEIHRCTLGLKFPSRSCYAPTR